MSPFDRASVHPTRCLRAAARVRALLAGLAIAVLGACGGGGEGGNVSIGTGQGADPVVLDFPVFYVKRTVQENQGDARRLAGLETGADLYMRERASPSAADRNLTTDILMGMGDVRDLDVSWDGRKVVFAMRGPLLENAAPEDQPTWNVWEYDLDADALRRVIASDLVAEEGQDRFPHYLPDGRIVFSSTRQRQSRAILLDEGKPQYAALEETRNEEAFVLHVMNDDGSDIHQISFNQSHDRDPLVMPDGRVAWTRWDHGVGIDEMNLYSANPDGSRLELLYGAASHATGTNGSVIEFVSPQPMPDGRILAVARPYTGTDEGGDLITIDVATYVENTQPLLADVGVLTGPAQERLLTTEISTEEGPSPGGRYTSAFPLWDGTGRLLVAWSQCRLVIADRIVPCTEANLADPGALPAPPLYGLFVYDPAANTQLPVVTPEEGAFYTDLVAAAPRTTPATIVDGVPGVDLDADLVAANVGILHVASVYDVDGTDTAPGGIVAVRDPAVTLPDERPARFVRLEKPVSQPDDTVLDVPGFAFGPNRALGMREILGYAPIEPDGSFRIEVPADVALSISVLDVNGRRIGRRHATWLQLRPGEVRDCQGCHDPQSLLSHGRADLFPSMNPGAPDTGVPFPNTDPALFADFGETMAQTRSRISCNDDCAALEPSVDVVYDDVWTDEAAAGHPKAASFTYAYRDLSTPAPVSPACETQWTALCRIVINYLAHVQPLWELPRIVPSGDPLIPDTDNTCTNCHAPVDAIGQAQVPAAGLDLTASVSAADPDHVTSYQQLFDNGVLTAGSAQASNRFFDLFATGASHAGRLTPAELRLVSEWVDIGGQYYNDPFAVPAN